MNKYEFHVGDYVETKDGEKGFIITDNHSENYDYIVKFNDSLKTYKIDLIRNTVYSPTKTYSNNVYSPTKTYSWINIDKIFNRIGKYDFTKPQKENKIEPLNIEVKHEQKSCDKVTTYANGDLDIKINTNENIVTGIKDIPNYDIYSKINEIINYINSKED